MTLGQFKLLPIFLLIVFLFLQHRLWFAAGGISDMIHLKKQLAHETLINTELKKRNEILKHQVLYLQKNQSTIESRARQELGMIKKDETFYQVVE
ncbi:MAG: septum formation initiator family protein [Gammaproteobacteria bacterium]|nr:septum formation initiator family protein [Gammaproteobacteria bacterium]